MPAAALAGPLIGAGGSILGSVIGGNAAKSAGKLLGQTGINVAHSLEKATGQAIDAGYAGMDQARGYLQDYLRSASDAAAGNYGEANRAIGDAMSGANQAIAGGVTGANQAIQGGVTGANQALQNAYGQQMGLLSPYLQAGGQGLSQLAAFMAPGGAGTKQFDASMMESQDPGYQFRLQQAQQALDRSAAARGSVLGGAQGKALDRYSQDYASNEYQNAWSRYMQGQQQQFGMLQSLANYGANATGQAVGAAGNLGAGMSGNIMGGAGQIGQNIYGGAGLTSGNLMTGGGRIAANYANLADTLFRGNMSVGQQLANNAMQGNQWIGTMGLQGANMAGNAYMQGAQGQASGALASGNAWAQGLGNAFGQIGGGLMNNYNNTGNIWGRSSPGGGGYVWQGPIDPWQGPAIPQGPI